MSTVRTLHLDVETRSAADLKKIGAHRYFEDPTTDCILFCYAFDDEPVQTWMGAVGGRTPDPVPEAIREHIEAGGRFVGHNVGFEWLCFKFVLTPRYGFPELKFSQCDCTAAMAAAMSLPRSLAGVGEALKLDVQKDEAGSRVMRAMAKPRRNEGGVITWWETPEKIERLRQYCVTDVETERAVEKRVRPLSAPEREVWQLDHVINQRGAYVDLEGIHNAMHIVRQAIVRLDDELGRLTDYAVPSATMVTPLREWLNNKGVPLESVDKSSLSDMLERLNDTDLEQRAADALADLTAKMDALNPLDDLLEWQKLNEHKTVVERELAAIRNPRVKRVIQIRQEAGKSSTAKLQAFVSRASDDRRVRDNLVYHGGHTGRFAAFGIQLQNMPRPEDWFDEQATDLFFEMLKKRNVDLIETLFGPPLTTVSYALRGMITAAPGKLLLISDFANIEGRVLAWLAGEKWKLDAFRAYDAKAGPDLYKLAASSIYHVPHTDVSKAQRQIGKVAELACGYQGGVGAFQTMATTYGVKVPDAQAEEIKTAWRQAHQNTVQFWYDLDDAAMRAVHCKGAVQKVGRVAFAWAGNVLWCRLPSGRLMAYPDPRIALVDTPWGDKREAVTYMGVDPITRKWLRMKSYGGKFAENITQAVARDIMVSAMLRVEKANYPVILTVHDEVVSEVDEHRADAAQYTALMETLPDWAAGLPVKAESEVTFRYKK